MENTEYSRIEIRQDNSNVYKELREYKFNGLLDQKRRQQLRENSHELRQLERQLQSALVFKQLREQQQNIAHRRESELCAKREENAKFAVECEQVRESILHDEEREKTKKVALFGMLECQIRDLQQKRRIEFEDIKKDCDEMENMLKQIQAEKIVQRKETKLMHARFKIEVEESRRDKKLRQQLEKDKSIDEAERNLVYQRECEFVKSQMVAQMKRIKEEKEALSERIGQELAILNQEKENRENLFLSLLVEERKSNDDQRYKEALVKQIEERKKFRTEMENLRKEIKIREERQFKMEEEKFLEEHLRYLEHRDKIIQLSDQKRRQKRMEHNKALREMVDLRRREKANEIAARIADFEKKIIDEKKSDQLIKEERIRMLSAVPKEILSYLPPDVLKSYDKEFLTLPGQAECRTNCLIKQI